MTAFDWAPLVKPSVRIMEELYNVSSNGASLIPRPRPSKSPELMTWDGEMVGCCPPVPGYSFQDSLMSQVKFQYAAGMELTYCIRPELWMPICGYPRKDLDSLEKQYPAWAPVIDATRRGPARAYQDTLSTQALAVYNECARLYGLYVAAEAVKRAPRWVSSFFGTLYADPKVIEHATPVMTSWGQLDRVYQLTTSLAEVCGLQEEGTEGLFLGGGGHIHITIPGPKAYAALWALHSLFPVLGLSFLSPYDKNNAQLVYDQAGLYDVSLTDPRELHYRRCSMVNLVDTFHVEFRAFDMPTSFEEAVENMALVQSLVQWAEQVSKKFSPRNDVTGWLSGDGRTSIASPQTLPLHQMRSEASVMMTLRYVLQDVLKLPWSRYKDRARRNLAPHFQKGSGEPIEWLRKYSNPGTYPLSRDTCFLRSPRPKNTTKIRKYESVNSTCKALGLSPDLV